MKKEISHLQLWNLKLKLRKWTTPFHILAGLLIAALIPFCPIAAILLFVGIAYFEYWNWIDEKDTGVADWWEILLSVFIGSGVILVLKIIGVL